MGTEQNTSEARPARTPRELRQLLERRFSRVELRMLAFDLGVDYEDLAGATHSMQVTSLLQALTKGSRLADLERWLAQVRPELAMPGGDRPVPPQPAASPRPAVPPTAPNVALQRAQRLNRLLRDHFSLLEVAELAFDLGVSPDELGDQLRPAARELTKYAQRHGLLPALAAAGRRLRPELDWQAAWGDDPLPAAPPVLVDGVNTAVLRIAILAACPDDAALTAFCQAHFSAS
ncbi:MAG: hypothetical protein KC425_05470, partial [Anaerolineales bacterium]|nr:hypothetical protein [Anaerolineales bacterium]